MRCGVIAIVIAIALAVPTFGQHGGHIGAIGHSGFAGHAGFSGSRSFSGPVRGARYGGFARPAMPMRSRSGVPYRGLGQYRPAYRSSYGSLSGYDRDRRRRSWYGGAYPGWGYVYPYPYVIDPGFYDWGDTNDYGSDQGSGTSEYAPYADYDMPYQEGPQEPYSPPQPYPYAQQPAPSGARPAFGAPDIPAGSEEPLTLIFKDGRAPQKVRNYMMNSQALTDFDPQHFERIPLDEIDIAATVETNRARGVDFEVPQAERE